MKLKNKRTGEIGEVYSIGYESSVRLSWRSSNNIDQCKDYNSLAELCEEWEDYEEPRTIYYIDWLGRIQSVPSDQKESRNSRMSELGNYFDSYEEAEKAVEKLKAWKRLKDNGFKFDPTPYCDNLCGNGFEIHFSATMPPEAWNDNSIKKDLTFLFGGEE